MRKILYEINVLHLQKHYPLTISRGIRYGSDNLFIALKMHDFTGIGEAVPDIEKNETVQQAHTSILNFLNNYDVGDLAIQDIWTRTKNEKFTPPEQAALDIALWDLLGKKHSIPCYRLFGIKKDAIPTSITIGITSLDILQQKVKEILSRTQTDCLKVKLGSPDGILFDKEMFSLIKSAIGDLDIKLCVDANGGWSLSDAKEMLTWLAKQEVSFVEQPLAVGQEDQLPELYRHRPLPIFVDESCYDAEDVAKLANMTDGINIKLMKCGGLTEALRMIAVARAHHLKIMIGCMSESSVSISAACQIALLCDYVDLDSHLNIVNDPATGVDFKKGLLHLSDLPGCGFRMHDHAFQ